jgi:hypothetical protein
VKPCPFCGDQPKQVNEAAVACKNAACHLSQIMMFDEWNRRAPVPPPSAHFVKTTEVSDEAVAMEYSQRLRTHPTAEACPVDECSFCAVRDCPDGEPLHYHHDGCPMCSTLSERERAAAPPTGKPSVSERP